MTKIDIMILYSSDALTQVDVDGDTMQSMITDEVGMLNEAFQNSGIDLIVNLVRTQQVSDMS